MHFGCGKELPLLLFLLLGRVGFRPDPPVVDEVEEDRHDHEDGDVSPTDRIGDVLRNTYRLPDAGHVARRVDGAAVEELFGEAGPL